MSEGERKIEVDIQVSCMHTRMVVPFAETGGRGDRASS